MLITRYESIIFGYPVHLDQVLWNNSGMLIKECSLCPFDMRSIAYVKLEDEKKSIRKLKEWQNKSEKTGSYESFKKSRNVCVYVYVWRSNGSKQLTRWKCYNGQASTYTLYNNQRKRDRETEKRVEIEKIHLIKQWINKWGINDVYTGQSKSCILFVCVFFVFSTVTVFFSLLTQEASSWLCVFSLRYKII